MGLVTIYDALPERIVHRWRGEPQGGGSETNPEVRTMVAIEALIHQAARAGDYHALAIGCEAWERSGKAPQWLVDLVYDAGWNGNDQPRMFTQFEAETMVARCRYGKNRRKLMHEALAFLAVVPHLFPTDSED